MKVFKGIERLERRFEDEQDPRKKASLGLRLALYLIQSNAIVDFPSLTDEVVDAIVEAARRAER